MKSKNNRTLENSNLIGAKLAAKKMMAEWIRWTAAKNEDQKREQFAQYAAYALACKIFIERYLKQFFPTEKIPIKIAKDVFALINDIEVIERTNKVKLEKFLRDLDQLQKDTAA